MRHTPSRCLEHPLRYLGTRAPFTCPIAIFLVGHARVDCTFRARDVRGALAAVVYVHRRHGIEERGKARFRVAWRATSRGLRGYPRGERDQYHNMLVGLPAAPEAAVRAVYKDAQGQPDAQPLRWTGRDGSRKQLIFQEQGLADGPSSPGAPTGAFDQARDNPALCRRHPIVALGPSVSSHTGRTGRAGLPAIQTRIGDHDTKSPQSRGAEGCSGTPGELRRRQAVIDTLWGVSMPRRAAERWVARSTSQAESQRAAPYASGGRVRPRGPGGIQSEAEQRSSVRLCRTWAGGVRPAAP